MKTRKSYRKLIAVLLSIVTIIGCFSVTAFADEVETPPEEPVLIDSIVQVPSHEINFGKGGWAIALTNIPVYYDVTLSGSYQVGTISYGEGFTILANDYGVSPNYCLKVEYNTTSGPQQGYIDEDAIFKWSDIDNNLAHVNVSSTPVYYGPELGYYSSFGTVYYGEFVAVIGIYGSNQMAFIEYNAANGYRKRGYVAYNALYYYHQPQGSTPFDNQNAYDDIKQAQYVYSGPSNEYPIIGEIYNNEPVNIKESFFYIFNGCSWKYITYGIGNGQYKAGYIKY